MEHRRSRVIRRSVRAIEIKLHAFEVETGRERALAEFDVTTAGIIESIGFPQRIAGHALIALGNFGLDFLFDRIG